jgi:uncharacterized membrane protein YccC
MAAPLVIGVWTGRVTDGIFAALGALPAAMVSFQGMSRSRFEAVIVASLGIAVSTFVGATMAGTWEVRLVLIVLWSYLTGLSVALGSRWNVVILNWTVGLLLGEAIPLAPGPAAIRGCLALAGGLLQGGLVALSWALRPGGEERRALAASYGTLAAYATSIGRGQVEAPSPSDLPAVGRLEDPNPLVPREVVAMYVNLLEEAIRLRASLAALAAYADQPAESEISRFAAKVGTVLEQVSVRLGATPGSWAASAEEARRSMAGLAVPQDSRWRWAGETLLGQLRAVWRILVRVEASPGPLRVRGPSVDPDLMRPASWLAGALATLRANATITTEAGRHALRLAVATGIAELVTDLAAYPYGRWVVLTVLLVLKPDYTYTVVRGVQRAVGTLIGAVLVVGLAHFTHPSGIELSLAAVACIALAYVSFDASYLLFSLFLTAFIILMLDLLGVGAFHLAEERLGATLVGAIWALVVYVVWPTWVGTAAPEKFAALIERHGAYLGSMLDQLAHPERRNLQRLRHEQDAARRARSDAEAAAERLLREPTHPPLTPDLVRGLMAVSARLALGLLATQTLVEHQVASTGPATSARLDALTSGFRTAFGQLAAAMRTLSPPGALPPLQTLHRALQEAGTSEPSILVVADALVDSVGSLAALLDRDLNPGSAFVP